MLKLFFVNSFFANQHNSIHLLDRSPITLSINDDLDNEENMKDVLIFKMEIVYV